MADESRVSPAERTNIDFEIALIGKVIEAQDAKGITHEDCGVKYYQKQKPGLPQAQCVRSYLKEFSYN